MNDVKKIQWLAIAIVVLIVSAGAVGVAYQLPGVGGEPRVITVLLILSLAALASGLGWLLREVSR